MGIEPQPPRPPAPPQPPATRGHFVIIALLLLALIVVAGSVGVWVGLRFLASNVHLHVAEEGEGKKKVSIETPLGSIDVNQEVNEASLGLPIYPGATRMNESGSATVKVDIADETKIRIIAGKFETSDSLDKVVAFYHDRLAGQVTGFKEKDAQGKTVFEIKQGKLEKVVAIKSGGDKTVIELVRVSEGQQDAN